MKGFTSLIIMFFFLSINICFAQPSNDLCGNAIPLTHSGMSLYSGSCGALTEIECDDDDSNDGLFSLVSLTGQTPSDIIFIRTIHFSHKIQFSISPC